MVLVNGMIKVRPVILIGLRNGETEPLNEMKIQNTNKAKFVYILYHVRSKGDRYLDTKIIGVYSLRKNAVAAKRSLINKPGFSSTKKGFYIGGYILDKTFWVGGFVEM
jgi:hypothetical protein